MVEIFKNDEAGYGKWLRDNPHGYIYNDFGGANPSYKKHIMTHFTDKVSPYYWRGS